ncbi:hypothetical protein AN189_07340 [Loktanella sp. 3ANDIMAR09]|nr:hypothetical protein AN189_07340 [Loktanella sp. 3ANDIMAR09]
MTLDDMSCVLASIARRMKMKSGKDGEGLIRLSVEEIAVIETAAETLTVISHYGGDRHVRDQIAERARRNQRKKESERPNGVPGENVMGDS